MEQDYTAITGADFPYKTASSKSTAATKNLLWHLAHRLGLELDRKPMTTRPTNTKRGVMNITRYSYRLRRGEQVLAEGEASTVADMLVMLSNATTLDDAFERLMRGCLAAAPSPAQPSLLSEAEAEAEAEMPGTQEQILIALARIADAQERLAKMAEANYNFMHSEWMPRLIELYRVGVKDMARSNAELEVVKDIKGILVNQAENFDRHGTDLNTHLSRLAAAWGK